MNLLKCNNCGQEYYLKDKTKPEKWTCGNRDQLEVPGCSSKNATVFIPVYLPKFYLKITMEFLRKKGVEFLILK